jgi:M6 family metalloprotease-like protein
MFKYRLIMVSAAAICLTLVCAFLFTGRAEASPAAPLDIPLTQPDGTTTFVAFQWGDEWNHGYETAEGYTILQDVDGWWVYAVAQPDGLLGLALVNETPRKVGIDSPEGLTPHLRPVELKINPNAASVLFADGITSPEYQNIGTQPVLVILGQYTNHAGTIAAANFATEWFGATNSIKDFFLDNSFNQLTLTPAIETSGTADDGVVGWVTLGATHPASDGSLTDPEVQQIARDAILQANPSINFASYDVNPTDGYISQWELHVFVIVAGHEGSYDGTTPAVWAHNWSLEGYAGAPTVDGVVVGDGGHSGGYSEVGELHAEHQATMGTMAHELGHDMSNPDLYDIDGTSEGVGQWSVQGSGNWNYVSGWQGTSPAFFDPWIKSYQGWIVPTNVDGTLTNQAIAQAETTALAYRLRPNPGGIDWEFYAYSGTGEYFLVENRQNNSGAGYDDGLPGCGLLIWHIDESVTYTNSANANEDHALVWVEQADGLNELANTGDRGDTGDPWPGSTAKYDFSSITTPNSNLYSGSASNVSVHIDSTSCASSMQADLTYAPPAPSAFNKNTPANTAMGQSTSLTLDWGNSTGATSYDYCLETPVNGSCTTWTTGLTSSQASVSGLLTSTSYEWQARAVNGGGMTQADGGTLWTFSTGTTATVYNYLPAVLKGITAAPAAFSKTSPTNAATGVSTTPTLDWADATDATSYEYCYDLSVNGDCTGGWTSSGTVSQVTLPALPNSTTYEWQARAVNLIGTTYANGGTEWSFTTAAPIPAWTIITSEDFETAIPKAGWSALDISSSDGGDYKMGRRACNINAGSYSGWLVGGGTNGSALACGASYVTNHNSWFIYGPFSTVGATAAQLNYNFYTNTESCCDAFWVMASDNNSNYWGTWRSGSYAWAGDSFDLNQPLCGDGTTSCLGKANVWIAFSFDSDDSVQYAYGANVDNIVLRKCTAPTCSGAPPFEPLSPLTSEAIQDFLQPFLQQFIGFGSNIKPQ